ncbi:Putative HPr kinase/phosphorylase [Tistrella mobilis]|uniref:HPr kinase/phosphorylase n=1 Tax=Tistrella mobilis (strain KA081020-065) TaxID=1110502 RepID=I3TUD2_TISMK|nr:Putative HPr kinase/phosphorylase [Tistrella mobilis]AFK56370.1 Putative HPr kinase/phosphorylase [Tistrella mobilis KA081020-065]
MDRLLFGWRIASDIPLPELPLWPAASRPGEVQPYEERPADITIRRGPVPARFAEIRVERPLFTLSADGEMRIDVKGHHVFLVRDGREVVIDTGTPDDADCHTYLLGPVLGALCHQRGEVILHAAVLRFGDAAVAFCGQSGAGKSTLAASLLARGHRMLADDVTVLRRGPGSDARTLAWPAYPRMRLWQDAASRSAIDTSALDRCVFDIEKFVVPVDPAFDTTPLPLAALVHLDRCESPADEALIPLKGLKAAGQLRDNLYRAGMAYALDRATPLLQNTARLAAGIPRHLIARRHIDDGAAERLADRIEAAIAAGSEA